MNEISWTSAGFPWLGALQLLPLLGAVWMGRLADERARVRFGRAVVFLELLLALGLYQALDSHEAAMQLVERGAIPGPLDYHVGADGLTVLFVLLTTLLTFLVLLYIRERHLFDMGKLVRVLLVLESLSIIQLVTLNLLWFILASAAHLGLLGFVLWHWATSPEKDRAMARFYQFQGTGLVLLLGGALLLGWNHAITTGQGFSFDLSALHSVPVDPRLGAAIFFLLFYGLGVRTPIFPFHGWLPEVAQHGNVAIGPTFLLGVKIGIYGLVRFVFPVLPEAVSDWHVYAVAFAVVGVFYAATLALLQSDLRRLMAYGVVSHTGLVVLGLFTLHHGALQGAILLAVTFGLAATAMLFMVGLVFSRTRTTQLDRLGGLFDRLPFIGIAFFVAGLATIAMPGTPGFEAAHLLLEASMERFGALVTVAAALGNVVVAGFMLYAFQRAFLAPAPESARPVERASRVELALAGLIISLLLAAGFHLEPWFQLVDLPLQTLAHRFSVE